MLNNQSQNKYVSADDISKNVGGNLSNLDAERADELEALLLLRKAKDKTLMREYNRLLNVLGVSHPRALRLLNKIDVNNSLINDLAAEVVRARATIPDPSANGWILWGYVRDKTLRGVAKVAVALYTQNGNEAKDLGAATTNEDGYFRLDADGGLITKYPFIQARVRDGASTIHADDNLLQPKLGRVDYLEMVIT